MGERDTDSCSPGPPCWRVGAKLKSVVGTRSSGAGTGATGRERWTGCGVWVVVVAWEAIFFWELQFEWPHRGQERALEETAGQGSGEGVCPGLQAPRGGSQRRKSPREERAEDRPALPPGKRGMARETRGPRARPGAVRGQGSVGPRGASGLDVPTLAALLPRQTPMCRGPCSIVSLVTSSLQSCLGRQCCSVQGDSLSPDNLGSRPRSHLSCLLQSLVGPSSTRSTSCKATRKAGRRGPGRRRLTAGPASSRRCTLRTSTSITGTAGRVMGTVHVQGGSRCRIWGLRLFRSIRFHF